MGFEWSEISAKMEKGMKLKAKKGIKLFKHFYFDR